MYVLDKAAVTGVKLEHHYTLRAWNIALLNCLDELL